MDLIYTDAKRDDLGVLLAYSLDLSYGEDENDFELVLGKTEPMLEDGALIYIEGTEYGGIVSGQKYESTKDTRTNAGSTWHGILESKIIQPDPGADYLIVSGNANEVLGMLIQRLGLASLFSVCPSSEEITITGYQFARYVGGYSGIRAMLAKSGGKLKMRWVGTGVQICAEPITDYTGEPVDSDVATLSVERYGRKVNHLICLGPGELAERAVVHLYADQSGRIGNTQHYTGLEEVTAVYDYSNAESLEELRAGGVERLRELRDNDKVTVTAQEGSGLEYDVGDIIGGTDTTTGNTAKAAVVQKIVKINNGAVSVDYKTGG